jgi:raffinose/stachyose/melibiose transport system substrate-binding protein
MTNRKLLFALFMILALLTVSFLPASAQDDVTLVVWDNWTRESEQEMIDTLNAEFEDAHPGVTIQRESYDTSDLTDILPLAMSEADGPDVAMINQGFSGMGALVEAGLLLPLEDYADQFGWWDRYAMGLHARNSFTEDGMTFGEGHLYGISYTAEVVGAFYHKDIFEANGLTVPETWDDFVSAIETLSEAGVTPIVFGSLDGWPAIHTWGAIQHAMADLESLDDFMFRREGGTFDTDYNLESAQMFVDWAEAGYFSPGFEGMDYDGATTSAFLNEEGAMWITGSWMAGTIIDQLGEEAVGFFVIPSVEDGAPPLSIGGVGLAYGIRATSENADLAAEYIDLVTGPHAADLLLEQGFLPAAEVDADTLEDGTLTKDVVEAWQTISSQNAVGHYLDWTVPNIAENLQELLGGVVTPEEFVADVEADYTSME